jgi:hypothetical protein
MKKILLALLLILVTNAIAQQSKRFERNYKYMRMKEPDKVTGDWTAGSFALIFNFENKIDKIQLVIEKATLLYTMVSLTKHSKTVSRIEYQEAKLEGNDGTTSVLTLYPKDARLVFSDGSGFELSN